MKTILRMTVVGVMAGALLGVLDSFPPQASA
jgi:hypothetical protein